LLYIKLSYAAVFLQFGAAAIFLRLLYMALLEQFCIWRCCILSFAIFLALLYMALLNFVYGAAVF
jgi:hypothetical protein